ncbi:type II toxin-antitoxin system HicB family antitoxin [Paracoccus aminovorans]|uniref:type II toxin-antitoxin system HicB family antitoxin n=1 Tax=Paracoccus aminovorans TaxID=34004 RepID=UPI00078359A3|nr:type II toxin-antitoxin system HicB family antitoxin [Paracoccus aminovorans]MDQ7777518.1 type II toxin-antitoxin system HicB family antitoxin [Paracoccus aminovorans]
MKTYLALVEKDEDSAFGIRFPDLPGCFSAADAENDILPNAVEAIELWFEDQPITAPGSLRDIAAECAEELAAGAFLIAVPHVRRSTRQRRVNVSLDAGTLEAIDTAAGQLGLTRSGFLAMAALNEIKGGH